MARLFQAYFAQLSPLLTHTPPSPHRSPLPFPQRPPLPFPKRPPHHSCATPVIPAKLSPVIPAKAGIHNSAPIMKQPALYIMGNKPKGTLYTNVTSNLKNRMWEHRTLSMANNFAPLSANKIDPSSVKKLAFAFVLQSIALTSQHEHA